MTTIPNPLITDTPDKRREGFSLQNEKIQSKENFHRDTTKSKSFLVEPIEKSRERDKRKQLK